MAEGYPSPETSLEERLRDAHLGTLHSGVRYEFGFGPDFYGIWDDRSSGLPAERFPPTTEGRDDAWRRYRELEPGAGSADPPWVRVAVAGRAVPVRPWWARQGAVTGAVVAVLVGGLILLTRSKDEEAGPGGAPIGAEAHVEITGAVALTEDLQQESFEGATVESLVPEVSASWTGATVELQLSLVQPRVGEFRTAENPHRRLTLVVDGVEISSLRLECSVTLDTLRPEGISGSFTCSGLPAPGGEGTIDADGTFAAEASSG